MKQLSLVFAMVLMFGQIAFAQRTVTGTVTDPSGEPLISANVVLKGTTVGTLTDLDGKYSLEIPNDAANPVLEITYIGFQDQNIPLGASNILDCILSEGITLNEAVVTALGVEKDEKALGYAVQSVGGDDLVKANTVNVVDALSGRAAGVNITSSSGSAGASSRIVIRGNTSLSGDNQAIFVIDGIRVDNSTLLTESNLQGAEPSNRAIDINPDDIASVSVLKGAAATALYGVEGAKGVILITTKKGKASGGKKFSVNLRSNFTLSKVSQLPALQNKYSQGSAGQYDEPCSSCLTSWGADLDTLYWDGNENYQWDPNGAVVGASDPSALNKVSPYDNVADFFQTGFTHDHNLSISGGGDFATYRFSIGHTQSEGVVPLNKFDKTSFRIASTADITDRIRMSGAANFINSGGYRIQRGNNVSGIMLGLLRTPVTFDNAGGYDDPANTPAAYSFADGTQRNYRDNGGYDNPYWTINNAPMTDDVNRLLGNIKTDIDLIKKGNLPSLLTFTVNLGADWYTDRRKQIFEINSREAPEGRIIEDQYFVRTLDNYFILNGSKDWGEETSFGISYSAGMNLYSKYINNLYTTGDGLTLPGFYNLSNASGITSGETITRSKNVGVFSTLGLSFNRMLYLDLTARYDAVSNLITPSKEFKLGDVGFFYPSASLSFVFSELIENKDILSFGKLRLSYAQVGGGAESPYGTSTSFEQATFADGWTSGINFPFAGSTGFSQNNALGNPNLTPYNSRTYEAGLDVRFFNGRLGFDYTYYNRRSSDQIITRELASSTGFSSVLDNAGLITANGHELIVNATPVKTKNFTWDVAVNFDRNITEVVSLNEDRPAPAEGETQDPLVDYLGGFVVYNIEGQPYGMLYGGVYERDESGNLIIDDDPASTTYGLPSPDDNLGILGNPNPDYRIGLNNSFNWKGLNLSFLWDFKKGGVMWNGTDWALTYFGRSEITENREDYVVYNGVKESDGSPNDISVKLDQGHWQSDIAGFGSVDEAFIQSTSWARLRELSLGYTIGKDKLGKTPFSSATVSFTARNLLLFTPYTGVDPETSLTGTSNAQGVDYFNMPGTKTFSVGLNLGF